MILRIIRIRGIIAPHMRIIRGIKTLRMRIIRGITTPRIRIIRGITTPRIIHIRGVSYFSKYLREIKKELKTILACLSGTQIE